MLEEIKQKVQTIANNSSKQIIVEVYRNMITSHNEFCGCNYCSILSEYVRMKKYLSANNRRMDDPEYDYYNNENVANDLNGIKQIREKISELKQKKNELKTI
jgi:hypothetical protein